MSLIDKLLNNKCVRKFINFLESSCGKVIDTVNLGFVDGLFMKLKKTKRGAPCKYSPSQLFRLVIEAMLEGKRSAKAIARYGKRLLVKLFHKLNGNVSHDTISRFFSKLCMLIEEIFYRLVKEVKKLGILSSRRVADTTDIETRFKKDEDARWSYDSSRKCYYFGYGALICFDPFLHLPTSAKLTESKKVDREDCKKVFEQETKNRTAIINADAEFDIIELIEMLLRKGILLIATYNKRNSKQNLRIRYRLEQKGFPRQFLDEEHSCRTEAEHAISTLKEHFGLRECYVRGWKKVETYLFLVLCVRLLHGIATFKQGEDPRKVTLI